MEPWVTDGTAVGTEMLTDLCPGECDSRPIGLELGLGEAFLFAANDGVHGQELWSWRPASGSVVRLLDLCPGECSGAPRLVGARDDRLYVVARRSPETRAVFEIDEERMTGQPVADLGGLELGLFEILFGTYAPRWTLLGDRWVFWAKDEDRRASFWSLQIAEPAPTPPPGPPLTSAELPGFSVHVRIGGTEGILELEGATPGSSELPGLCDRDGFSPQD